MVPVGARVSTAIIEDDCVVVLLMDAHAVTAKLAISSGSFGFMTGRVVGFRLRAMPSQRPEATFFAPT